MEIVYLLLPASLVLVACGFGAYVWAVRSGQFDDLETPRWRTLFEEEEALAVQEKKGEEQGGSEA